MRTDGGYATVSSSGGFGATVVSIRRGARGPVVAKSEWLPPGRTTWRVPARLAAGRYTAVVTGGCVAPPGADVTCLGMWGGVAEFAIEPYRLFRGGAHLAE